MESNQLGATMSGKPGGVLLRVKVVPGASRSRVAGILGDRLKILVAAPPEQGKANRAVCELLAASLGVRAADVRVTEGATQPRKTIEIDGMTTCDAVERLAGFLK